MNDARKLAEVAKVFTRLGFTAFGGPAAHIALMRQELVTKRAWLDDTEFLRLLGLSNLIPGPTSTELAIYLGYRRAGRAGLVLAGICFIVPAMAIVLSLAWAYVRFGALPQVGGLLWGMKPVVVAIVLQALVGLGRSTLRSIATVAVAFTVLALSALGWVGELWLVFVPGFAFALQASRPSELKSWRPLLLAGGAVALVVAVLGLVGSAAVHGATSSAGLFLVFLKVGSVLYGSGYVLLSYLHTDLVVRLGWLTKAQLLDAIAVGQFTPGPVFTTATFVGFVVGGVPGALAATVGIFLPSFLFVGLVAGASEALQTSAAAKAFLSGVNAAALGLMGAVLVKLGQSAFVDVWTYAVGLVSLAVLLRTKLNSFWLVAAGAAVGLVVQGR